jgi:TolB-like protein
MEDSMKKGFLSFLVIVFLFCSCNSLPASKNVGDRLETNKLIEEVSNYLNSRLPSGSRVSLINSSVNNIDYSDFILERLSSHLVNSNNFTVVARKELDPIKMEQQFQLSGDVSDETMASIGKFLGAEYTINCSVNTRNNVVNLWIRAINVETAVKQAEQYFDVNSNEVHIIQTTIQIPPIRQFDSANAFFRTISITDNKLYGFSLVREFEPLILAEDRGVQGLSRQLLTLLLDSIRTSGLRPEQSHIYDVSLQMALKINRIAVVEGRGKTATDGIFYCMSIEKSQVLEILDEAVQYLYLVAQ